MKALYTYSYSRNYQPAMPVVEVRLGRSGEDMPNQEHLALVDSGADGTLVPIDLLEQIGARQVGTARIRGIVGQSQKADLFLVSLQVGSHVLNTVRAVAGAEGDEIILGRNILNHLVVTLNGLASTVEIPG
jgi:predicted aspartyl protease